MQEVTIDYRPRTGRIIVVVTSGHEHPDALDDCTNRAVHALSQSLRQISTWAEDGTTGDLA